MKVRTPVLALAALAATAATVGALVGVPAAQADPVGVARAAGPTGGWSRLPAEPFTSPAGDLCGFALHSEATFDQVYARTTRTFADGRPRRQEYAGPLVVRLTNQRTGAAVSRDLSGRAVATYRRDGGYDLATWGPVAVGFHDGDGLPNGYYVLRGHHVVRFAADGTRTVVVDRGREQDACRALR